MSQRSQGREVELDDLKNMDGLTLALTDIACCPELLNGNVRLGREEYDIPVFVSHNGKEWCK